MLDFGIAKLLDERTHDTGEGSVIGSADYMAPEQSLGEPLDGRADLYALGVIAFQLVTGRLPFNEPPALSTVILRALAKRPEDRFQSAATMRTALLVALDMVRSPAPRPCPTPPPTLAVATAPRPSSLALPLLVTRPGVAPERMRASDLSRGGLFVCTEAPLPPLRARVQLALELPDGALTCAGEVVRHVRPEEALAWRMGQGFGVQFLEPSIAWKAAVAHLLQGQPLSTLRPDSTADDEVEKALAAWPERGTEDLYALLGLPPETGCEEVRLRARRAQQALERLRERPLSAALRTRVEGVLERLRQAGETLGTPVRRAAHDAERGNFHGVARCLGAGLTVSQLEVLRRDFLARHPHAERLTRLHLATAQAHESVGQLSHAREAYERALTLDPLSLELHKLYLSIVGRHVA